MVGTRRLPVLLLLAVFTALLLTIALNAVWGNRLFVNEALHSAAEAFGSMSAEVMAIFLLQGKSGQDVEKYSPLAVGFLAMGILDGFHAISRTVHGFILFHGIANLAGGLGSALIWSPRFVQSSKRTNRRAAWSIAGTVTALGIVIALSEERLPAMILYSVFTPAAIGINVAAGVLFVAAAVFFLIDFFHFRKRESFLFSSLYLLFGLAELEFPFSAAWNAN